VDIHAHVRRILKGPSHIDIESMIKMNIAEAKAIRYTQKGKPDPGASERRSR
jgi:hypothetical protein